MRRWSAIGVAVWLSGGSGAAVAAEKATTPPPRPKVVEVQQVIPDLVLDLRYATDDNFLKRRVYPKDATCFLRREAAEKLKAAAEQVRRQGFRLRVFDCYRPLSVQWEMWKILPKPGYVADPNKGSKHNRGIAVDLTLADAEGNAVEMPTDFDTFSKAAHHGFEGASEAAKKHRAILREAMEAAGFKKNRMEWWHYDLPGAGQFPILDVPLTK